MADEVAGGSVGAFRALNHNALHSIAFQVKRGGLPRGGVSANMKEFDSRCRRIVKLRQTGNLQNLQNQHLSELWEKS